MTNPGSIWNEVGKYYTDMSHIFAAVYWVIGLLITIHFLAWVLGWLRYAKRESSARCLGEQGTAKFQSSLPTST